MGKIKIKNISKNKILCSNADLCRDVFSKFRGLMFSRNGCKCLIFVFDKKNRISLHMFFVFYTIDVIFLDEKMTVVDQKEKFSPFTVYKSKKNAKYVIELPKGTISRTKTEIGDILKFYLN